MKIVVSGGTGFIGSALTGTLASLGHDITILTRKTKITPATNTRISFLQCDPTIPGTWQENIIEHEVIVNLAGTSIFRRWNKKNRNEIVNSRIRTTNNLVESLAKRHYHQIHFISASGVGYYGYHKDEILDESCPQCYGFLSEMAIQWEAAAYKATNFGARVVICRLGQVLGKGGGALPKLIMVSKLGMGGTWGNGKQWTSWIHQQDIINIVLFLIQNNFITGDVNVTSPDPVRNKDMMQILRQHLNTKSLTPSIPSFMLRLAAGEFSSTFLNGQRVIPGKLLDSGYSFIYPTLNSALSDLI